jgi:sodium-dependent dicarboxylate transporter 2/3/5
VSFVDWFIFALPVWLFGISLLTFLGGRNLSFNQAHLNELNLSAAKRYLSLGAFTTKEKLTVAILSITIFLWVLPGLAPLFMHSESSLLVWLKAHLNESTVVMLTTSLLFILPISSKGPVLTWDHAKNIDWGTLLLFGAGISLGQIMFSTGLVANFAEAFAKLMDNWPLFLILLSWFSFTIFFTEFTSNTATANLLIPLIIAFSEQMNIPVKYFAMGIGLSCNLAFMLPVATPPNAIVYGTNLIKISSMIKAGIGLNILMSLLLSLYLYLLL